MTLGCAPHTHTYCAHHFENAALSVVWSPGCHRRYSSSPTHPAENHHAIELGSPAGNRTLHATRTTPSPYRGGGARYLFLWKTADRPRDSENQPMIDLPLSRRLPAETQTPSWSLRGLSSTISRSASPPPRLSRAYCTVGTFHSTTRHTVLQRCPAGIASSCSSASFMRVTGKYRFVGTDVGST